MRTLSRLVAAAAALVAAVVLALAAPAAHADSIAYVKGGDVWLSTADGKRQFQVTATGAYQDVSQADDGTMIALSGVRLHKLDRMGTVLANFDTPVSDTRPPAQRVFWGPFDPVISPDGKQVAYSWYYMTQSQDPGCHPPDCYTTINEAGTGYSHSDRQTGWDEPGFKKHGGWRNPVWVDNGTTLISDMTHWPNTEVTVDDRTATDNQARLWFTDDLTGNPSGNATEGDITRDTKRMAYVTGESEETLTLYYVPVFPREFRDNEPYPPGSAFPVSCYRYGTPAGGKFRSPTFSPSGSRLAWADSEGVKVVNVPDFAAARNCTTDGASQTAAMLIPGAVGAGLGPGGRPGGAARHAGRERAGAGLGRERRAFGHGRQGQAGQGAQARRDREGRRARSGQAVGFRAGPRQPGRRRKGARRAGGYRRGEAPLHGEGPQGAEARPQGRAHGRGQVHAAGGRAGRPPRR